ncbi:MAG: type III pantothenate kinase [Limnochordales bacterium]
MLLALDIGNTNTTVGLFDGDTLKGSWRIQSDREKTADEYGILLNQLLAYRGIDPHGITAVAIACVLPPVLPAWERVAQSYFGVKPLIISYELDTGLAIRYQPPRDVGADRIANAAAAKAKYPLPAIVVDLGTATTFDCISKDGEYLGGAIAPGVQIAAEALFVRAAKLPRVDLSPPPTAIGRNTVHAMQAGTVYGYAGLVRGLIERIRAELGGQARVIATGGLAEVVARDSGVFDVIDPHLTLEGLRLLYLLNHPHYEPNHPDRARGGLNA